MRLKMVGKEQERLLDQAREKLKLSAEEYKEMLMVYGGARTVGDLTPEGFFHLMERFRELGFMSKAAPAPKEPFQPGELIEMVTPAQKARIHQLENELGWGDNPSALENFILTNFKIKRVVTKEQAVKVIDALKALLENRDKAPTGTK